MYQKPAHYVRSKNVSENSGIEPCEEEIILKKYGMTKKKIIHLIAENDQNGINGYWYAACGKWIWNSQENRTPMSKTLSGKRVISEASPFDQWREVQFIGSVAPAAVVVGLDPVEPSVEAPSFFVDGGLLCAYLTLDLHAVWRGRDRNGVRWPCPSHRLHSMPDSPEYRRAAMRSRRRCSRIPWHPGCSPSGRAGRPSCAQARAYPLRQ